MQRRRAWLTLALMLTALAYLPGIDGEFIYDDITNFESLNAWIGGQASWQAVILEHNAGPLGRPVAMLTFLANAALTGMDPFWFKLTNLMLHLLIGLVVYQVLLRLSRLDRLLNRSPETAALLLTSIWLLHPMMVGTVLYVVQRMAMLSVLFMLLALLAYLVGRARIESGHTRAGSLWLWIGVPGFTLLAALSKENGLLAPLLCAVIEWVYYRPKDGKRRPNTVRSFFLVGLVLPAAVGMALFLLRPEFFLQGFENRPFTLIERLLTQGRVLFDYIGNLLLPIGPSMSLFRDDYRISVNLISPWTTTPAVLGWMIMLALAVRLRDAIPAFSAGVGVFLVGHAMESSVLPLMIYFEHRNYLPAIGVFLAVSGLTAWMIENIKGNLTNPGLFGRSTAIAILVALSAATFARASLWSSNEAILRQSLERYPDALAMRLGLAELEMNRFPPDLDAAQAHYRHLLGLERPSIRLIGAAGMVASSCHFGSPADESAVATLNSEIPDTLEADFLGAMTALTEILIATDCAAIRPAELALRVTQFLQGSKLSDESPFVWQLRYRAAQLFEHAGRQDEALEQAQAAWHERRDQIAVGMMILRLELESGRQDAAAKLLESLTKLVDDRAMPAKNMLDQYRLMLEKETASPEP